MRQRLIQLLRDNAEAPPALRVESQGDAVSVYLKGVISSDYGIGAQALRDAFDQAEGKDVFLYINSPGGDAFEGREMQGAIVAYSGKVTAVVQGVCASAATFVTMACDEVQMLKGSRYMIHNGWTLEMGDKHAMRATADLLDSFDKELAAEYARKTGQPLSQLSAWMDAETWFTADQAKDSGFVDKVLENTKNATAAQLLNVAWDLSAYANAPADIEPEAPDLSALISAQQQTNRNRLRMLTGKP